MNTIVELLNQKLSSYPYLIKEFAVIDSFTGIIVTFTSYCPSTPSQRNNAITSYGLILRDSASIIPVLIGDYLKVSGNGHIKQYVYVFGIEEK